MDCLRSFAINLKFQNAYNSAGTNVKSWGTLGNYNWQVSQNTTGTNFLIDGFKRIDLYGIQMVGGVFTDVGLANAAIVSDYGLRLTLTGQTPLVSGSIVGGGFYPIYTNLNEFVLSKYTNALNLSSPISGVTNINFGNFYANGNNGETLNSVELDIELAFVFYYKYDGE